MLKSIAIASLTALSSAPALAAQSGLEAVVDSIAHQYVDGGSLAGMSVAVTRGPDTLLFKAFGYADLEWNVPMPTDAIHEIGSVTKQFTSAALMQLWADGKIDLDADLTTYLPDYDTQGRSIPLRRLFDHTSGIKGYTEMEGFEAIATRRLPRDSLVAMFEAAPLEFEPGQALIYNNSAYFLLGLILETVSGQSYADYLEEHVFAKAGMKDTSYCSNDEIWDRRAHGYQPGAKGLERADYIDHTWPFAAGSICSTIGDLVAWNRALHGGQMVSDAGYALMTNPAPLADGTPVRYAMGLTQYEAPSGRVIEHGGGIPGFVSQSRYYPEDDVVVVVLFNTTGPPGPAAVADAIGEYLLGTEHAPRAATFVGDLSRFVGKYRGPGRGRELTATVALANDTLWVTGIGPRQALAYRSGTSFFQGMATFDFETTAGDAHTLRIDQIGGHYVLERVDEEAERASAVEVPQEVLRTYVGTYAVTPEFRIEVTLEDGQLGVQATGQSRFRVFARSQTEFRLEVVDALVEFVVGEDGSVSTLIATVEGVRRRAQRVPD